MATTLSNFTSETQLTTSEVALVSTTATASQKKLIGMATVTNTSDTAVEVTVWRLAVDTIGTTGSGGNWLWKQTIYPYSTVRIDKIITHVLDSSMKISALADTAGVINIDISGTSET